MPGRLRQSAVQSSPATNSSQYNVPGLEFSEALAWRAGKAIAVADLLSRLQKLAAELRDLDQGHITSQNIRPLAQDLAHSNLLGHKDKGIRAWTLCCIVDILNICAPDAPFGPVQLKDIFTVVVNTVLSALADPSNAYNAQHIYILNSLTDTKSIVLITDLEHSETLIVPLFTICFDIVSGAGQNSGGVELAKSVEFQLRSMLVTIIDETTLPQEVTDIILSQFLRVDPRITEDQPQKSRKSTAVKDRRQDTLHLKDYPPAYNMAKSICTTCPDKMSNYITQYFGTVIINASAALEHNDEVRHAGRKVTEADESDEDNESLGDLRKVHRLVRELWRACPDVLLNVVPQIETELAADSTSLRQLATETLGDIIAGIGVSGPPPHSILDPTTYPLSSIEDAPPAPLTTNPLMIPASPKPFGSVHNSTFNAFLGRQRDKASAVRMSWVVAISRILLTDAGGIGLSVDDRAQMLAGFSSMLEDADERVRLKAIQSLGQFDYHGIINTLASDGGLSSGTSFLSTLASRVTDRKQGVRDEAVRILSCIWGVGCRDIENGVEKVVNAIAGIPNSVFKTMFINDVHSQFVFDKILYENLLPLSYPPVKGGKPESQKRRGKDKGEQHGHFDTDHVRVRRILTMADALDDKAKVVFFALQRRQVDMAKAMKVFLKTCEDYNGGVVDDNAEEQKLKEALTRYISQLSKQFPEPSKASSDLWKFARQHDRRSYQLIRFSMEPEHDYRTMTKAIKELNKRIKETGSSGTLHETIQPLVYRCALMVYNRSHVPSIMEISRSDEGSLASIAHETLRNIAERNPEVLKSHIQALCDELEESAPTPSTPESASAADTLKACSDFARKYPADVSRERKFLTAMTGYALNSRSPRAAKHAVTILLTISDKKEFHAKDLLSKALKDCKPSIPQYEARLAAIGQLCLLAPSAASVEDTSIQRVMLKECLLKNQSPHKYSSDDDEKNSVSVWETTPSNETVAKVSALKALVNRCRGVDLKDQSDNFDKLAENVLDMLLELVRNHGEMTPSKDTPPGQRNRLRSAALHFILKLCAHRRRCEELVSPQMFISVAMTVINPPIAVRTAFIRQLRKYLGQNKLHNRWYTALCLLAFEPDTKLQSEVVAWIKSRMQYHARQAPQKVVATSTPKPSQFSQGAILESTFSRLVSLLAHHPDYPDLEDGDVNFDAELLDFSRYIVFYLQCVATEENLSLIFHIAQRVKQTRDAVTGSADASRAIYVLSDLSQAVIRNFADIMPASARGVNLLQTYPGRVTLPANLFAALSSHKEAQDIVSKNFLPEDVATGLPALVRSMVKGKKSQIVRKPVGDKKRKSDSVDLDSEDDESMPKSARKPRKASLPIRRTPKSAKRKAETMGSEQPSRKSARTSNIRSGGYAESDEEDEKVMNEASSPIKARTALQATSKRARLGSKLGGESTPGSGFKANGHNENNSEADGTAGGGSVSQNQDEDEDEEVQAGALDTSPLPERVTRGVRAKVDKPAKATSKSTPAKAQASITMNSRSRNGPKDPSTSSTRSNDKNKVKSITKEVTAEAIEPVRRSSRRSGGV